MENNRSEEMLRHMELTKKKIEFYKQALNLLNENQEIDIEGDNILSKCRVENAISVLELSEAFGIPLEIGSSCLWASISSYAEREYMNIGFFPKGEERISWSDDGMQPEDEHLLVVSFPTGAYIFGGYFSKDYPTDAFNAFFDELKSYGPKYADTVNHCLYFTSDVAADVYWNFKALMNKYRGIAIEENKRRKREKLEAELKKLEEAGDS